MTEQNSTVQINEHAEDFASSYANNVSFQQSAFDMTMIFGQLDQSASPAIVKQHTAITVPWSQAKLMSYYLQVALAIFETLNGKIKIPATLLPSPIEATQEELASPVMKSLAEPLRRIHQKFIESL